MNKQIGWVAVLLVGLITASGCSADSENTEAPTVEPVAVAVATAQSGRLTATHNASGQIEPALSVPVTAKVPGRVVTVHKEMGDTVTQGELLAKMEDRDAAAQLSQARATLAQAEAQRTEVNRQLQRLTELLKAGAVSQQQVEQTETQLSLSEAQVTTARASVDLASANLERTWVTAPASGVLASRSVEPGAMVGAGSVLFHLVDLRQVIMKTGVAERDVNVVQAGASVPIIVPALNQEFVGKVEAVSPNMDRQTRSYQVRISLENPDNVLKGGMFAQARLPIADQEGILVPVDAVTERGGEHFVYLVVDGVARRQQVTLLVSADDMVAVQGIEVGAQVVIQGQNRLFDGAPVAVGRSTTP